MPRQFAAIGNEVGLTSEPLVADGAEKLILTFADFGPDKIFTFVIDLDDRLESSDFGQAVVSGNEIADARAEAFFTSSRYGRTQAQGAFGSDGKARLSGATCV